MYIKPTGEKKDAGSTKDEESGEVFDDKAASGFNTHAAYTDDKDLTSSESSLESIEFRTLKNSVVSSGLL